MESIVIRGAREHNLKNIDVVDPPQQVRGHHRRLRLGQVVAGLRHDLRRGAAALRRVALRLRPAVPRADGEAGRRLDRGALAGDLHRAADDLAQSALDRRHRHRDLRLPAAALRLDRRAALHELRPGDPPADDPADGRPPAELPDRDEVHRSSPPTSAARRGSTASRCCRW